jgi:hypothetical protein
MLLSQQKAELVQKLNQYNSSNCPYNIYRAFKIISGKSKLNYKEQENILVNTYKKLKIINERR